jgi:hypothetical protein
LVIEWDAVIVEMSFLAGIIYFSVYLEHWAYRERPNDELSRILELRKFGEESKLDFTKEYNEGV